MARLTLRFTEGYVRLIEDLKRSLLASSQAEVVRIALGTLKWMVDQTRKGRRIVAIDDTGQMQVQLSLPQFVGGELEGNEPARNSKDQTTVLSEGKHRQA